MAQNGSLVHCSNGNCKLLAVSCWLLGLLSPHNDGQWSMVNGQWSMVNGQWFCGSMEIES